MKRKVIKSFYFNRKLYKINHEYDITNIPKDVVGDYFEKPAKKKVRKSKPKAEKIKTTEEPTSKTEESSSEVELEIS